MRQSWNVELLYFLSIGEKTVGKLFIEKTVEIFSLLGATYRFIAVLRRGRGHAFGL